MRKNIALAAVNAALLLLFAVSVIIMRRFAVSLESQLAADRWGADGSPYAQLSLFLEETGGVTVESVYMTRANIEKGLTDNSLKANTLTLPDGSQVKRGRLWTDAYSGSATMFASSESYYIEAAATYTGGDYFLFHPLPLVSGGYYSDGDLMKDGVVIDVSLAWQLYGATDVAGMQIKVDGGFFRVTGVVAQEPGKATAAVYGDLPRLYIPYESAVRLNERLVLTCYEACLPNPIGELAYTIFKDAAAADENRAVMVVNSERYSLGALWRIIKGYSEARVRTDAVTLPYFENAARIVEAKSALTAVFAAAALVFPVLTALYLLRKAFKHNALARRILHLRQARSRHNA
jgi:hypothetical protein